jgi:hypothetical protein
VAAFERRKSCAKILSRNANVLLRNPQMGICALFVPLKGLSHEMDLAFDDMYGEF